MVVNRPFRNAEASEAGIHRSLLKHRDRPRPSNLPLALTSFVGRIEALSTIERLLLTSRLLTLSGPGGVGKTRLALQAASALLDRFEDGVWWVDLAPVYDAGLVAHTVMQALAVPDDPTRPEVATLGDYLHDKTLLLVLDNCEHLIGECAELAEQLLSACARLRILTTSRETLGIAGEVLWPVPPLTLPHLAETPAFESLTHSEAGQLFLERARAVRADLPVTEAAARAMIQVCYQLDGIPLAIELAAARVQVLSVSEIAARLDDRFRLLTGGSRTALPRHQTLKAAIDWSYDLLAEPEQQLFRRLAVFSESFTLESAEAVASDLARPEIKPAADFLDLLSHLVTKSLLARVEGRTTRYQMLETLRQYGWERLLAAGELEQMRQRHLAYYLRLARRAEVGLIGADQLEWLKLLELEHDNLRSALTWSQESEAREAGLHLATALAGFWLRVGYLSEGFGWLNRALAACREVGPVRIRAVYQAGRLAQHRGDYEQAFAFAKQSLALSRHLNDRWGIARALGLMGWNAHLQGAREAAGPLLEEGLALARAIDDERTVARTLLYLGDLRLRQGALELGESLFQESLGLYQRMGDEWSTAWALCGLGETARSQGDYKRAVAHLQLGLSLYQDLDSKSEIPFPLESLALTAVDQGRFEWAAHLWGAASALRDSVHALLPPSYQSDSSPILETVRTALGEKAFAAAWAKGRTLSLEQALSLAVTEAATEPASAVALPVSKHGASQPPHAVREHGLTPREVEVLRVLALGLSNAQIAERLAISPRTVGKHLQSIFSKLYVHSRSAATRWAIEHHLD